MFTQSNLSIVSLVFDFIIRIRMVFPIPILHFFPYNFYMQYVCVTDQNRDSGAGMPWFIVPVMVVVVSSLSSVRLFATPWTTACHASLSMGFSRQEYWSGLPFPPPVHLPSPGIELTSPTLQVGALPLSHTTCSPIIIFLSIHCSNCKTAGEDSLLIYSAVSKTDE